MLRVLVCVALVVSGCAIEARPAPLMRARTENRTGKIACPTDAQIRAIAVAASRATYLNPNRPTGVAAVRVPADLTPSCRERKDDPAKACRQKIGMIG